MAAVTGMSIFNSEDQLGAAQCVDIHLTFFALCLHQLLLQKYDAIRIHTLKLIDKLSV